MISPGKKIDLSLRLQVVRNGMKEESTLKQLLKRRTIVSVYMKNNTGSCDRQNESLVTDAPALAATAPQTAPTTAPATAVVAAPATTSIAAPVLKSTPRPAAAAKPDPADEETIILDTTGDTTKNMAMDPTLTMAHEEIMADLENTAHHVNMPSDLNSPAQSGPFVERRKSVIDVLRAAIEREPHRRELKMKLLELYYAAAASNQAAFLEVAKALARDRDVLASGDWDRIVAMGRSITPNERLFLPDAQAEAVPEVTDSAA
jgi:hypothetical protein